MEIQSGSGHKEDPFVVLVMCMHERVVTAMNIWIPVYFWMRWGVNVRDDRFYYVQTEDNMEHSSWGLRIMVCLGVEMYKFLNVGVCVFMSVGECHGLSEYISLMSFYPN